MKDQLGAMCSGLCIVHCLVTPVILALGVSGIAATILSAELFHQLLVMPVLLFLLLTVIQSYKVRGASAHLLIGVMGAALLITALTLYEEHEVMLTLIGGGLLIIYHVANLRLQHRRKANQLIMDDVTS